MLLVTKRPLVLTQSLISELDSIVRRHIYHGLHNIRFACVTAYTHIAQGNANFTDFSQETFEFQRLIYV